MFLTVPLLKSSPKQKKNNWGPDIKRSEPISRGTLEIKLKNNAFRGSAARLPAR
jgi:hypothetical protein